MTLDRGQTARLLTVASCVHMSTTKPQHFRSMSSAAAADALEHNWPKRGQIVCIFYRSSERWPWIITHLLVRAAAAFRP